MPFQAPDGWPPDCPPSDADPTNGEYFHLACANPLSFAGGSFQTAVENGLFNKSCPCQRCGISVFPSEKDLLDFLDLLTPAKIKRWKCIAKADLTPEHGVVKFTRGASPRHMTWWTALDKKDRIVLFVIVKDL